MVSIVDLFFCPPWQANPAGLFLAEVLQALVKQMGRLCSIPAWPGTRRSGAMGAVISTSDLDPGSLVEKARQIPPMQGSDLVGKVTTKKPISGNIISRTILISIN
jgi:hypothetical protein